MNKTLMALVATANIVSGATITYAVDNLMTGTEPTSSSPYLTVTMVDIDNRATNPLATMDLIGITVESSLTNNEFFSKVYLDIESAYHVATFELAGIIENGTFDEPDVSIGSNIFSGGGSGQFDIALEFNTSNNDSGAFRFDHDDSYTIIVGYDGPESMTADNLGRVIPTTGDNDPFALAHVQGINDIESGWVSSIPEPSTALLTAFGCLGLIMRRKR